MKAVRARTTITYHGRTGKPMIHWSPNGRAYIMVRKRRGGTKRMYLGSRQAEKLISNLRALKAEAKRRKPK